MIDDDWPARPTSRLGRLEKESSGGARQRDGSACCSSLPGDRAGRPLPHISRSPGVSSFPSPTPTASAIRLRRHRQLCVAVANDPAFRDSIENTLILIATLPIWVMLPLLLAILIHQGVPGGKIFRAVYFFPAVLFDRSSSVQSSTSCCASTAASMPSSRRLA